MILDVNQSLFPNNSPIAINQAQVSSYQFDYQNEAGVVSSSKIRNASIGTAQIQAFNFNQGTGGTLTLGGTANGNGVLQVLNAAGGTVVQANNTGLAINNGSITINNSSGSLSYDLSGVVSSTNFFDTSASTGGGLNQAISGTADTPLTGGTLSFSVSRDRLAMFIYKYGWYNQTATVDFCVGKLNINNTEYDRIVIGNKYTDLLFSTGFFVATVPSGTYTLTMTAGGMSAGTTIIYSYDISYIFLGT